MRVWFKFFGRDFRDGVRGVLTLEEAGAYAILLTLIYETENRLLDDERIICAHLNVDPRVWRRIRKKLLAVGKLHAEGGLLTNSRATSEITSAQLLSDVRRTSGRSGGEQSGKSRRNSLKTQEPSEANASDLPLYARALPEADTDISTGSLRSPVLPKPRKRAAAKQGVDADLSMPETARAYAAQRGFLNGSADALWERFTAHHASKGTQFASIEAGWRNWVLNEIKFAKESKHGDGFSPTGNRSAGARPSARPHARSASSLIMERALADELEPEPGFPIPGRLGD